MIWDSLKLKKIRKVLSWTPAQMARRLGLTTPYYLTLESNESPFNPEICVQLDLLQASVDQHTRRIRRQPVADTIFSEAQNDQVTQTEVDEFIQGLKKLHN